MDVARFKAKPAMGIVRGVAADEIEPLVEAVIAAGLETIEITMNTKGAPELIRRAVACSKGRLMIGAGTVLGAGSLKQALDAGASFIVMPACIEEVMGYCVKFKIPVFAGALTPQEVYNAWGKGATMVKVFPAKCFGPEYFRELKGPFNDVELLACAGVTPQNMRDYLACGASAIAFGASVFREEWLRAKDFQSISCAIQNYLQHLV